MIKNNLSLNPNQKINKMSVEVTAELLKKEGRFLKYNEDFGCTLYAYNSINFVVLFDGAVVTQEEDNVFGAEHALFPTDNL